MLREIPSFFNLCEESHPNKNHGQEQNFTEDFIIINFIRNTKPFFNMELRQIPHNDTILTEEGVCYVYNGLNSREIYSEQYVNFYNIYVYFHRICFKQFPINCF